MMSAAPSRPAPPRRRRAAHGAAPGPEPQLARAQDDYRRLRSAYLRLAKAEPHEVALAMVGADMDRAHAVLQELGGLAHIPFTHEPGRSLPCADKRVEEPA